VKAHSRDKYAKAHSRDKVVLKPQHSMQVQVISRLLQGKAGKECVIVYVCVCVLGVGVFV